MPDVGGIAGDRLRSFIERIERLEEEKRSLQTDIKEVFAEAKGSGFDTRIMRQLIKERRMDKDDLDEQQTLLDIYRRALGMLADTPLGESALRKAEVTAADTPAKAGKRARKSGVATTVTVSVPLPATTRSSTSSKRPVSRSSASHDRA